MGKQHALSLITPRSRGAGVMGGICCDLCWTFILSHSTYGEFAGMKSTKMPTLSFFMCGHLCAVTAHCW